jgi:hypothetical protein
VNVELIATLADGTRLVDGSGNYLLTGHFGALTPPRVPTGLLYDPATGDLQVDHQTDASHHRIYSNDYAGGEGRDGLRDELVTEEAIAVGIPTTHNDGPLQDDEVRVYDVCAWDEYYAIEGPPSRPVFAHGANRRTS